MLKVEETKIITIDNNPTAVDTLPEKAKQLVKFYDDWKQKELEARSELLMVQTSMQAMANQIVLAVKEAEETEVEDNNGEEVVEEEVVE